jgi:hypothetical protein
VTATFYLHIGIPKQIALGDNRQAQQKIEGRAFGSLDAESAAEWLEKNCPELGNK